MYMRNVSSLVLLFVFPIAAMETTESSPILESREDIWQLQQWDIRNLTHLKRELILRKITQDLAFMKKDIKKQAFVTDNDLNYITTNEASVDIGLNMLTNINEQNTESTYAQIDKLITYYISNEPAFKNLGKLLIEKNKKTP